jgi:hypothetical protein
MAAAACSVDATAKGTGGARRTMSSTSLPLVTKTKRRSPCLLLRNQARDHDRKRQIYPYLSYGEGWQHDQQEGKPLPEHGEWSGMR